MIKILLITNKKDNQNFIKKIQKIFDEENVILIDKIYSKNLTQKNKLSLISSEFTNKVDDNELAKYISHLKAWKYIIDNNIQNCIILEDNIDINENILDYKFITEINNNIDILLLDNLSIVPETHQPIYKQQVKNLENILKLKTTKNKRLNKDIIHQQIITTFTCYYISLSGANKLIKYTYPLKEPLELLMNRLHISNKLKIYSAIIPLCYKYKIEEEKYNLTHPIILDIATSYNDTFNSKLIKFKVFEIRLNNIIYLIFGIILGFFSNFFDFISLSILFIVLNIPDIFKSDNLIIIFISYILFIMGYYSIKGLKIIDYKKHYNQVGGFYQENRETFLTAKDTFSYILESVKYYTFLMFGK